MRLNKHWPRSLRDRDRNVADQLWRDLRLGTRMLKRNPVFTIAVITSLALGIGVNTAVFTLVNTLVFRPLPVHDPSHLVRIGSLEDNGTVMPLPGPVLDELRKDSLLKGICGFTAGDAAVGFGDNSVVVPTLSVTGDCYQALGVRLGLPPGVRQTVKTLLTVR